MAYLFVYFIISTFITIGLTINKEVCFDDDSLKYLNENPIKAKVILFLFSPLALFIAFVVYFLDSFKRGK